MIDIPRLTTQQRGPTVLFLGAGAAMADGLPSTDQVAARVRDFLVATKTASAFLLPNSLSAFIKHANGASLMRLISDVWELYEQTPDLMEGLYYVIAVAAAKSVDTPTEGINGYRRDLIERLYQTEAPLFVLTTNWDTSLDTIVADVVTQAAPARGIVDYGFKGTSSLVTQISKGKPIHLFKLNGSADWFVCNRCRTIEITKHIRESRGLPPSWDDKSAMVLCRACKRLMLRPLVLPTLGKARNDLTIGGEIDSWLNVHEEAAYALLAAQDFLFVGYSLPDYDTSIRTLLSASLRSNPFIEMRRSTITVVAKGSLSEATRSAFDDLLGDRSFQFFDQGLEHFLSSMRENHAKGSG